jgi:hypothetical protein
MDVTTIGSVPAFRTTKGTDLGVPTVKSPMARMGSVAREVFDAVIEAAAASPGASGCGSGGAIDAASMVKDSTAT